MVKNTKHARSTAAFKIEIEYQCHGRVPGAPPTWRALRSSDYTSREAGEHWLGALALPVTQRARLIRTSTGEVIASRGPWPAARESAVDTESWRCPTCSRTSPHPADRPCGSRD